MTKPILLNPNSYKNIESTLKEIRNIVNIDVDQKWVFVVCNDLPYCLSLRIVESKPNEFNFPAIIPGLGHLHKNQMKTIFRILEDVLTEPLGEDNFQNFTRCLNGTSR